MIGELTDPAGCREEDQYRSGQSGDARGEPRAYSRLRFKLRMYSRKYWTNCSLAVLETVGMEDRAR